MLKSIRKTAAIAAFTLVATLSTNAFAGGEDWSHDFKASVKKATSEKKDLLLDFTGSDWCGWCIKLNKEVFSQNEFKSDIPNSFVLVELDYPRDKSKMSKETLDQNAKLKDQFKVRGFPSIYLADHTGKPYAKTGYKKGGAAIYNKHLIELQKVRIERDKYLAKADNVEGVAKAKLLDKVIDAVGEEMIWAYKDIVTEIIALDIDDEAGLRTKYTFKLDMVQLTSVMGTRDWDNALAMIESLTAKHAKNGLRLQAILSKKAEAHFYAKKPIAPVLKAAIAAAPDSKAAASLKGMLERFKDK